MAGPQSPPPYWNSSFTIIDTATTTSLALPSTPPGSTIDLATNTGPAIVPNEDYTGSSSFTNDVGLDWQMQSLPDNILKPLPVLPIVTSRRNRRNHLHSRSLLLINDKCYVRGQETHFVEIKHLAALFPHYFAADCRGSFGHPRRELCLSPIKKDILPSKLRTCFGPNDILTDYHADAATTTTTASRNFIDADVNMVEERRSSLEVVVEVDEDQPIISDNPPLRNNEVEDTVEFMARVAWAFKNEPAFGLSTREMAGLSAREMGGSAMV